ncbi:RlpA-like double-psi beta-barrel-protein domain-containing protein-containing protein [Ephemerocybe angulata]|uniref:RlpA-like double-psi beta-barrel-protein domain-containing protein-containing protein n=1 Tax=Ephemerocybe angulata TaxID=980116 RepID=A0A8H6HE04_9AGAR|nr:RlpA-like double-psi beta-barrel-protein domain-containing protein-containing protein [Tulosesus angulatus]
MASRILSVFYWLCLFATLFMSISASPVPSNSTEPRELEKRVTRTGRATWFNVGLGNCGKRSKDSDPVVAMSKAFYDRNGGSNCGQWVEIINTANGKKAYGQLLDSCPGCKESELDISPSLFKKFAPLDNGIFTAQWHFMAKGWSP